MKRPVAIAMWTSILLLVTIMRVQRGLKQRAAANDRSMEAEARAILTAAVGPNELGADWIRATEKLRGPELPIPSRSALRDIDLL